METVLALPLFMLLIGGAVWIGELKLARQKLAVADRYVAWAVGNRHVSLDSSIAPSFFEKERDYSRVVSVRPTRRPGGWWHETAASVDAHVRSPVWIEGWLSAHSILVDGPWWSRSVRLQSRYVPGRRHFVVSRASRSGVRERSPDVIAGQWRTIFDAEWEEDEEEEEEYP